MINVDLYTIPQAACDSEKANWTQVGEMVSKQLCSRFGDVIDFKHIEFMTVNWFESVNAQKLLEDGSVNFPFVLVDGEVACAEKKINLSKVSKAILLIISQETA